MTLRSILQRNIKSNASGFTLIELMLVVAIIIILAAAAAVVTAHVAPMSRDSRREADIDAIQTALKLYFIDNSHYPESSQGGLCLAPNTSWMTSNDSSWGVLAQELKPYLDPLPIDPLSNHSGQWAGSDYGYSYYSPTPYDYQNYALVYRPETMRKNSPGAYFQNGSELNYVGTMTIGG